MRIIFYFNGLQKFRFPDSRFGDFYGRLFVPCLHLPCVGGDRDRCSCSELCGA